MANNDLGFVPDEEIGFVPDKQEDVGFVADPEETLTAKLKRYGAKGLENIGKAASYVQGATISPLFAMASGTFNPKEYVDAIKGGPSFPTPSESLEKGGLGIPNGPSISDIYPQAKGKWYDISAGGLTRGALDYASDPVNWIAPGIGAAAKAEKMGLLEAAKAGNLGAVAKKTANIVVNPIEAYSGMRANKLYKKAFDKVDREAMQAGKSIAPSKLLQEKGFSGGMDQALETIKGIHKTSGERIGDILKTATEKGATVNLMEDFAPALDLASTLRGKAYPEAKKLAQEIDDRILYAWQATGGKMPVAEANELKSSINQLIKDSGFAQSTEAAISTKAKKAISSDLSEGVKKAVKNISKDTDPELYNELLKQNEIYGSTGNIVQDKIQSLANTVKERRNPFGLTQVDMMLLGGAGLGSLLGGEQYGSVPLGMLAAKKFGTGLVSTEGRALRGSLLNNISKSPGIYSSALRQVEKPLGKWSLLEEKKNEEK